MADTRMANTLAYLFNTGVTYGIGVPNGVGERLGFASNKTVSEMYPTLLSPRGYAFSIWGAIFALEGYAALNCNMSPEQSKWWTRACVLQAGWTVTFGLGHRQRACVYLSAPILCAIAFSVRQLYLETKASARAQSSEAVLMRCAFGMHAAWTTAAALVNVSLAARCAGVPAQGQLVLAVASELAAAGVGAWTALQYGEPVFALVTAWALAAIAVNPAVVDPALHALPSGTLQGLSTLGLWLGGAAGLLGTGLCLQAVA